MTTANPPISLAALQPAPVDSTSLRQALDQCELKPAETGWSAWRRRPVGQGIDLLLYVIARLFICVIQILPYDAVDAIARRLSDFFALRLKIRSRTTQENLTAVMPAATEQQKQNLEVAMWHSLIMMICEIAWAPRRLHLTNWHKHITFVNNQRVMKRYLSGRPVVLVSGHFGNFEISNYLTSLMGIHTVTIARRLDNPYLHDWMLRFRGANGQTMVDKQGCAAFIDQHMSNAGKLAILADQHAGQKGHWTNFLGVPASCHKALALFSLTANAPMLVGYARRVGARPMQFETGCLGIADPLDPSHESCQSVANLTDWYNRTLARAIGKAPEQYWWLHRRWRQPPPRAAKRLEKARQKKLEQAQVHTNESAA